MLHSRAVLVAMTLATATANLFADSPGSNQGVAFFETRIRPVLVEHCYACHNSADAAEGELALDFREGIRRGGEGGKLIQPGDAAGSRLIAILKHEIADLEMPQDGPKLDDRVIADFERWISMGAPDPRDTPPTAETLADATSWPATLQRRKQWWSFQPINDPPLPSANAWSDHPIDRFIHAELQRAELSLAPPAEPAILIRRMFVNLIGLPPSTDELREWIDRYDRAGAAGRDGVTEELVDHLLASVHFGERWARHWMDWIRYAESHGSEGDPAIVGAWIYRDYLIRAINADVPYDQLVREHLAGDLMEQPRIDLQRGINESMIGPAHLRMVFHGFAPTDALDEKVRFVDDQINTVSKAFLGITVACARCHDHKFDAISQQDYYALFGILGSCRPGRVVIDVPDRQQIGRGELIQLKPKIREAISRDWLGAMDNLKNKIMADDGPAGEAKDPEQTLHPVFWVRQQTAKGTAFSDVWQSFIDAQQKQLPTDRSDSIMRWDLSEPTDYKQWTASGIGLADQPLAAGEFAVSVDGESALLEIYPAGVYSNSLSTKHPARLTSGDIDLTQPAELWVRTIGDGGSTLRYVARDYPRNGTVYPVTDLKPQWTWQRYDLSYWQGDSIHIELTTGKDAPLLVRGKDRSWFGVTEARLAKAGTPAPASVSPVLDRLVEVAKDTPPESIDDLAELYRRVFEEAIASWQQGSMTNQQAELLNAGIRLNLLENSVNELPQAGLLIQQYRRAESEVPELTRVPGLEETTGRTQPLFIRGNHKMPADIVPRRFLEAIDPQPYATTASGRLEFAEDILRDDNPLTRRVIVNRIWHHLFGKGIVATPDNLGRLGRLPTHPELLDSLAIRFAVDQWSLKRMIRLVVTSKTWQLASTPPDGSQTRDPENQLLSHASVRRMEAEVIRDSLLCVSGRLDRTPFGSPVDQASPRRSIYLPVIRNSLNPFLRVFDFPEPFSATGRRDVTNVPAQSLTLMNDPSVSGYAASFATAIIEDRRLVNDRSRISEMFLASQGRLPTDDEIENTEAYLRSTRQSLRHLQQQKAAIENEISQHRTVLRSIIEPAEASLVEQRTKQPRTLPANFPSPIGQWEFDGDLKDSQRDAHGKAQAGAQTDDGELVLSSGGYVVTEPLQRSFKSKTLEAWVRLDDLGQRGGGVMTVQTLDGVLFDSIVFGEQEPGRWMAGSNGFARTKSFAASQEDEAVDRFVHIAIVYQENGQIIGYRDGKPYGKAYRSNGPQEFEAGKAIVTFGVRHLPAGGNRMLAGRIESARLYDRALSAQQIAASYDAHGSSVSAADVLAMLTPTERMQVQTSRDKIEQLAAQIESLGSVPQQIGETEIWTELAKALFTFQEFIYVR
jgi:hypothetical protein